MKSVFLDHASTTPVEPSVLEAMRPYFCDDFGNPSSPHEFGRNARKALEDSRDIVAHALGAKPEEIIFTSGATESNNHAFFGMARVLKDKGDHMIVPKTEHHSVILPAQELKRSGLDVTFLDVDEHGLVSPEDIRRAITSKTIMIAVMHASNEVGTLQPVSAVGKIAREHNVCFLVDAVQTVGHLPVNADELQCDLLSLSAHKFYGPKGVGALYVRKGTEISSYLLGGDQERGRRASTPNVPGAVGMAKAILIALEKMSGEQKSQKELRDGLIDFVISNIPHSRLNGHPAERLSNNAHFSFEGIDGESLLMSLDMSGFCASMGSACTSGALTPSHVLKAMGLSDALALGSLRVTIGRSTTRGDIERFCLQLNKSVEQLRR